MKGKELNDKNTKNKWKRKHGFSGFWFLTRKILIKSKWGNFSTNAQMAYYINYVIVGHDAHNHEPVTIVLPTKCKKMKEKTIAKKLCIQEQKEPANDHS